MEEDEFVAQNLNQDVKLGSLIELNPSKYLGEGFTEKYPYSKGSLPFLFKVLSVNSALSI